MKEEGCEDEEEQVHEEVEKHEEAGQTTSVVRMVQGDAVTEALARMLSGTDIGVDAIAQAKALLEAHQS